MYNWWRKIQDLSWCHFDIFTGTTATGCLSAVRASSWGMVFWTAGQRIDPSRNSPFVWRVTSPGSSNSDAVSPMSYTNWKSGQPDYYHPSYWPSGTPGYYVALESCMHMWSGRSYTWNDLSCWVPLCSVCELDIWMNYLKFAFNAGAPERFKKWYGSRSRRPRGDRAKSTETEISISVLTAPSPLGLA